MIDKKRFYLVRTPNFGNGPPRPAHMSPVPAIWHAKQTLEQARRDALEELTIGGRPGSLDVFEVRLVGSMGPPSPQWMPVRKAPKRKAKRSKRS